MNFGNIGPLELLMILEIGASIGKGIREFKRNISDVDRQIKEPEREARSERLNAGEPAVHEPDTTSEPKRLIS
jgi:Sec-independent protein translocase protein TatA